MNTNLRALTLWPEWAWAVVHLGKRVENRDWPIPGGEWFALHAGKNVGGRAGTGAHYEGWGGVVLMARDAGWSNGGSMYSTMFERDGVTAHWRDEKTLCRACEPACSPVPTSAIVGIFRVTAHHRPGTIFPWKVPDAIGNVFEFRPLREPVPCKGAQGLWTVPDEVASELRRVGTVGA